MTTYITTRASLAPTTQDMQSTAKFDGNVVLAGQVVSACIKFGDGFALSQNKIRKQFSQLLVAPIWLHLHNNDNSNATFWTTGTMLDLPASVPLRIHGMHPVQRLTFTWRLNFSNSSNIIVRLMLRSTSLLPLQQCFLFRG